jgi:Methylamine utilisation protein MauE
VTYLAVGCALTVAAVFAASASSKLRGPGELAEFARSVSVLLPVAASVSRPVAALVAAAEAALVPVCLLMPGFGLPMAGGLLTAFAVAIWLALRRGVTQPCRCFGRSDRPLRRRHLVRAAGLAAVAFVGCGAAWAEGGLIAGDLLSGAHPGGVVVAALAAAGLAAVSIAFDDIIELFVPTPVEGKS